MQIDFGLAVNLAVKEPVGISFSGGADSAIAAYMLLRSLRSPVIFYTMAVLDRGYNHADRALALLAWFQDRFPNDFYLDLALERTTAMGQAKLFARPTQDLATGRIQSLITGLTANPPASEHREFAHRHRAHSPDLRNPKQHRDHQRRPGWCEPYTNHNKRDLAQLYREHGLMDTLFPLTRSCGEPGLDHCGACWSCEERLWAFGRLG